MCTDCLPYQIDNALATGKNSRIIVLISPPAYTHDCDGMPPAGYSHPMNGSGLGKLNLRFSISADSP